MQGQTVPPATGGMVNRADEAYRWLAYGFMLVRGILVIVLLGIVVHLFVATVFRISGESMLPNFQDGQFILVDRISYQFNPPHRGDVIVLQFPGDPEQRKFIKRVVGLPGEQIEVKAGAVFIDDAPLVEDYLPTNLYTDPEIQKVLRADEVFVMGDNRPNSNDSRFFGPLPVNFIIGKSQAILSTGAFGWVAQPAF
ncbi:signal peptidase I [Candidatus Berkelbacteria bacterium]|nr:signal peptidase I [Candidatus Berkelbacteria bacterium]